MGDTATRIGELAKRAGVSTSALRFYEEAGLLSPTERSEACYRAYAPEAIGRLQFVQRAKALGLTLTEIRQLLVLPHADAAAERDRPPALGRPQDRGDQKPNRRARGS